MSFRRSHWPAVRLVLPRRRSRRPLPPVPPLPESQQPESQQPEPLADTEPDADEIKVRERLLALLGEAVRWPR
ncbi:hypothetical protein HTV80_08230 [Streptomyces sp. Vc74B-19]|uniref:hypothetical protein n=1 Tax=Streptomyces sp. Vc74B-19 TaxID=2741324 RepID=UPI001BFC419C|nr:hypothetical protein [Streptomyces sp. Vc74B-19]MBT3163092.1 hypothetical protein [Streptomyces sp. Vc74B-19]